MDNLTPLCRFILMQEIDTYHFACLGILPIDCRTFFIIPKPDQTAETQELGFFGSIVYPAVVKLVFGLYPKVKTQHEMSLLMQNQDALQ